MTIKMVVSDLDGTFLNDEHAIPEGNRAAVKALLASGKQFYIATGRLFKSAVKFAKQLELDIPIITYNGGLVKGSESGKIFYEKRMSKDLAQRVLDYVRERGYYLQFYAADGELYVKEINEHSRQYVTIVETNMIELGEKLYEPKEGPYKMLLVFSSEEFMERWREFEEKFGNELDVTSSWPNYLELMPKGVNKWEAIKCVAELNGVKPEEIMCVGDSNNDLPMIINAGIGVAMGNARDVVKAKADRIAPCNYECGVGQIIQELLANEK